MPCSGVGWRIPPLLDRTFYRLPFLFRQLAIAITVKTFQYALMEFLALLRCELLWCLLAAALELLLRMTLELALSIALLLQGLLSAILE